MTDMPEVGQTYVPQRPGARAVPERRVIRVDAGTVEFEFLSDWFVPRLTLERLTIPTADWRAWVRKHDARVREAPQRPRKPGVRG